MVSGPEGLTPLLLPVAVALLGDALDGHDPLVVLGLEDAHALDAAAGDAHVVDGTADQLAAVRHQHDLIAVLHGEGGDEAAVPLVDDHGGDAFAAAAGDAVGVGRGSLA